MKDREARREINQLKVLPFCSPGGPGRLVESLRQVAVASLTSLSFGLEERFEEMSEQFEPFWIAGSILPSKAAAVGDRRHFISRHGSARPRLSSSFSQGIAHRRSGQFTSGKPPAQLGGSRFGQLPQSKWRLSGSRPRTARSRSGSFSLTRLRWSSEVAEIIHAARAGRGN